MQSLHSMLPTVWLSSPAELAQPQPCQPLAREVEDALLHAEDQMALGMWDEASTVLDALPSELNDVPEVAVVRMDLLIGQELWQRGMMLALGLLESHAMNAEIWFRIAKLMAGAGNKNSALKAASRCLDLDPDFYLFMTKDRLLGPLLSQASVGHPRASFEAGFHVHL